MNVNLLVFLGEVEKARRLGLDLASSSNMEPLDLQLAIGIAIQRGFVKKPNGGATPPTHGCKSS